MKPERIAILLSTYNGSAYLEEQIKSLLCQIVNVPVDIHIRDDGSSDGTKLILQEFANNNDNIFFYDEENIGVIDSFLWLVTNVTDYDYYAFCDQDDYWQPLKIIAGVSQIEKYGKNTPLIYCSAYDYVDKDLNHIGRFVSQSELNINNLMIENCAPGCTMIFNAALREKFCEITIPNISQYIVMHDWFFLLLGVSYGDVIYDRNSYLLYRQHANNVVGKKSGFLSVVKSRCRQFKREINRHQHLLYSQIKLLSEITSSNPQNVVYRSSSLFINSQTNFFSRFIFVVNANVKRMKKIDDVLFKLLYIFGYYK